ncbi:unnamed protein product [Clavelina lepadiformis]|uniref:Uncharacterized protein n=1 Tax=Clavelina lepadiformis TaxID=159417 RepID=A0ABP0G395_CLALP
MASFSWVEEYSLKLQEYYWLKEKVEGLREDTASDILSGKVDQIANWLNNCSTVSAKHQED